jgi:hypothetical protein
MKEARDAGETLQGNLKTIRLRRNMESFEKRSRSLNKPPFGGTVCKSDKLGCSPYTAVNG